MMIVVSRVMSEKTFLGRSSFSDKNSVRYYGTLPKLVSNLILDAEVEYEENVLKDKDGNPKTDKNGNVKTERVGFIKSYKIKDTPNNLKRLATIGIEGDDVKKYFEACRIQNTTGLKWEKCFNFSISMLYDTMEFSKADEYHKKLVNNPEDKVRLKAINSLVIRRNREMRNEKWGIPEYLETFHAIEETGCYACLTCSHRLECLKDKRFLIKMGEIWDEDIASARMFVNAFLNRDILPLMEDDEIESAKKHFSSTLTDEQLNSLNLLSTTAPCIITGGAGTGKTTNIKAIIEAYAKYYGTEYICLLAPTGKASRRMKEQTGFEDCHTIHSKLRKADDEFIYYNEFNKLPYNLIIVDESSMIDILLMRDLLKAVDLQAKVVFVGDSNQLPPVSVGEPFFEFGNDNRVDAVRLTKNHRQGENNGILDNANHMLDLITKGRNNVTINDFKVYDNFRVREIKYDEIFYYATKNTLNIIPYNAVCDEVNQNLKEDKAKAFAVGDKVIFLRNTKNYCNGDTGVVSDIVGSEITVRTDFDTFVTISPKDIKDMALAYALTVHKTQGSEYDEVKIFIPKNDKFVSTRMLYTAITRAKKKVGVYFYEPKEEKKNVEW